MSTLKSRMPDLVGVTHRMVQVPDRGGTIELHVAEAGGGAPVLLLHGSPQHWWEWRRVIPALAVDHRVLAVDLRGAGWSDVPARGYDAAQQTADVLALLDAVGVERVQLVAHDYSVFIGWRLAFDHRERLAGFTALGSPHPWSGVSPAMLAQLWRVWFQPVIVSPAGPRLASRGRQRLIRHMLQGYAPGVRTFTPDDLEVFLAPLRDPARARALAATNRRLVLPEMATMSSRWRRRALTVPTRILLGDLDPVMRAVPTGTAPDHAEDLRTTRIPGAAHFIASERPDAVVAAVRSLAT